MEDLNLLKRKLEREKLARKQAEQILEAKALELFRANDALTKLNEGLEDQIKQLAFFCSSHCIAKAKRTTDFSPKH